MRVLCVCYVSYMGYHCVCDIYGSPLYLSRKACVYCVSYMGYHCVCDIYRGSIVFVMKSMRVLSVYYVRYMGFHCVCDIHGLPLCLSQKVCEY